MPDIVEITNAYAFAKDGRVVLEDINLRLGSGEKVFLAAPLGTGKGLLLRWIAGVERPDKGSVSVFGKDTSLLDGDGLNALRCRLGLIIQENCLISNLKVIENCLLPLLYHTNMPYPEAAAKAFSLLESTGFTADPWEMPGPLPGYVKKQVLIARALVLGPEIIICENLGDGLTPFERARLFELILNYRTSGSGALILFTSTDIEDAAFIRPDRTLRIEKNRIVEER
ncbi:MAG: hypothetical protein A3J24_00090 [Deltaproteobacteria bacterium RIFCSPLOWO2_02_FULL_53_8]|nr:MAG: hypothetical protein A3J24_00090 [Deltaproteobacteria bacterium RIFCSPLOWO2_02_FULL_53_8]